MPGVASLCNLMRGAATGVQIQQPKKEYAPSEALTPVGTWHCHCDADSFVAVGIHNGAIHVVSAGASDRSRQADAYGH